MAWRSTNFVFKPLQYLPCSLHFCCFGIQEFSDFSPDCLTGWCPGCFLWNLVSYSFYFIVFQTAVADSFKKNPAPEFQCCKLPLSLISQNMSNLIILCFFFSSSIILIYRNYFRKLLKAKSRIAYSLVCFRMSCSKMQLFITFKIVFAIYIVMWHPTHLYLVW